MLSNYVTKTLSNFDWIFKQQKSNNNFDSFSRKSKLLFLNFLI